jgi:hypothetical protein
MTHRDIRRNPRPWDGVSPGTLAGLIAVPLVFVSLYGTVFYRRDRPILNCRFAYGQARSVADTAAVDYKLAGGKRPDRLTCGMLRRDGTLARYEAWAANR